MKVFHIDSPDNEKATELANELKNLVVVTLGERNMFHILTGEDDILVVRKHSKKLLFKMFPSSTGGNRWVVVNCMKSYRPWRRCTEEEVRSTVFLEIVARLYLLKQEQ